MEPNTYTLIGESFHFPFGTPERSDLLDRAIVAADQSGLVRAQFDARIMRMTAAVFGAEAELALALFAWCQSTAKDRGDVISPTELLWNYKFVLVQLPKFARISQQEIDAVALEMQMHYEACGASIRPVLAKRAWVAVMQGQIETARRLWDTAMRHPRDAYADCAACELSTAAELLVCEGRFRERWLQPNPSWWAR